MSIGTAVLLICLLILVYFSSINSVFFTITGHINHAIFKDLRVVLLKSVLMTLPKPSTLSKKLISLNIRKIFPTISRFIGFYAFCGYIKWNCFINSVKSQIAIY